MGNEYDARWVYPKFSVGSGVFISEWFFQIVRWR